jgi:hypothetical protein
MRRSNVVRTVGAQMPPGKPCQSLNAAATVKSAKELCTGEERRPWLPAPRTAAWSRAPDTRQTSSKT